MTAPTPLLRVVVLVSGRGSNLKAIAARADAGELPVRIEAVISDRAEFLKADKIIEEAALDKYSYVRDAYLQRRRSLIHDGNPPKFDPYSKSGDGKSADAQGEAATSPQVAARN